MLNKTDPMCPFFLALLCLIAILFLGLYHPHTLNEERKRGMVLVASGQFECALVLHRDKTTSWACVPEDNKEPIEVIKK